MCVFFGLVIKLRSFVEVEINVQMFGGACITINFLIMSFRLINMEIKKLLKGPLLLIFQNSIFFIYVDKTFQEPVLKRTVLR